MMQWKIELRGRIIIKHFGKTRHVMITDLTGCSLTLASNCGLLACDPEGEGDAILLNIGNKLQDYMISHSRVL
jgi:hypothetical protein